uniref:GrpE protein homolog n=1 Tax=Fibrocapsa japonica TaxID=94617 RepID=A0A7S2V060_9STRA|mmetsp:Transcript_22723/g.32967  ORF Transcript_22723/g.32967 Transcript_22723/m.32967 type:complete len:314 (+) Transcript_22723:56-997(+)|eukprot:CAMPEP_0113944164 /NCGR_PEP_ID=MMETSP1339-20121228/30678_1 /TAXON_ID=94617 /ORGANISM="Fibrocapsa japonica" /LENGTH=313 /DNA_ID=CAMNT_0000949251 /DNA_START=55 /DNA_END=996 /DNA_ORIENTATION=- /assembly_acc=CAM_ASM_000762
MANTTRTSAFRALCAILFVSAAQSFICGQTSSHHPFVARTLSGYHNAFDRSSFGPQTSLAAAGTTDEPAVENKVPEDGDEAAEVEAKPEEPEDAEEADPLAELKQQIEDLEKQLKDKEEQLKISKRKILDNGKTGYVTIAAEADNYKRSSKSTIDSLGTRAMAEVISDFMPLVDKFEAIKETAEATENLSEDVLKIHRNYQALPRQMMTIFEGLGASSFDATVGSQIDPIKNVASSTREPANDKEKDGMVVEALKSGFEINGVIIRPASCVMCVVPPPPAPQDDVQAESDEKAEESTEIKQPAEETGDEDSKA